MRAVETELELALLKDKVGDQTLRVQQRARIETASLRLCSVITVE